jgi:fibronectin type 3 domain-containing protein
LFKADPTAILTEPLNPVILENNTGYLLSWNQVNGATIYYVYRSTDPYRDFVRIGTSTTLSYQDDEVLPGNKYFYYITADNAYLIR